VHGKDLPTEPDQSNLVVVDGYFMVSST